MEKRFIEFTVVGNDDKNVFIKIVNQSHREDDFAKDGICFESIYSARSPEYSPNYGEKFFVRGDDHEKDDHIMIIPKSRYQVFADMIKRYNETSGGHEVPNWRAEKNRRYYYIEGMATHVALEHELEHIDGKRYTSGNYFRDRATAERMLEITKQAFYDFHKHIGE